MRKTILLFLLLTLCIFYAWFHLWFDSHVTGCIDQRCHFIKVYEYRLGTRDHHIMLYRWIEDKGWE